MLAGPEPVEAAHLPAHLRVAVGAQARRGRPQVRQRVAAPGGLIGITDVSSLYEK